MRSELEKRLSNDITDWPGIIRGIFGKGIAFADQLEAMLKASPLLVSWINGLLGRMFPSDRNDTPGSARRYALLQIPQAEAVDPKVREEAERLFGDGGLATIIQIIRKLPEIMAIIRQIADALGDLFGGGQGGDNGGDNGGGGQGDGGGIFA